jgi:peptidoglycan/xylan/chitin deacetylase (PgdA/CDA1 family)
MMISPDHFKQQMLFLYLKRFRCLSLSEVVTNLREGKPQPEHSFVLTFDDGYFDTYENASPILKKFGFSATVFVVAKPVEDGNKRYLSWQNMRELAQNNFTFGSHTLTHPRLSSLDHMAIKRELRDSKKVIEDRLGLPVDLLAYPYGDSDEQVRDLACQSGYRAACGVIEGHLTLFNLWRVPINENESKLTIYWKANGGYHTYTWLLVMTSFGRKIRAIKRSIKRERI